MDMVLDKKTARVAGLWYLAIAVFYGFNGFFADSYFFHPGDIEATVTAIQGSELLLRLGFVSCLLGNICFLFLVNTLYKLFSPVDKQISRIMVLLVVAGVSVSFLNRLNQLVPVLLLSGAEYSSALGRAQVEALAMLFLSIQEAGDIAAGFFWALWLLPLGILVWKSVFIPKPLAVLLVIACASYLCGCIIYFFFPHLYAVAHERLSPVETLAEVSFILWLLIFGVKKRKQSLVEADRALSGS